MERSLHEELGGFLGREEALQHIQRYHIYTPMFYRTNDALHARRVWRIVRFIGLHVTRRFPVFNQLRAEAEALVHDDHEIVSGDEQAGNKAKMTKEELEELQKKELEAIDRLSQRFPRTLGGFNYRELQLAMIQRQTLETKLVQFADKFDGFGEALHEIIAGNIRFATPVTTKYGELDIPPIFYVHYFQGFAERYPELHFLTQGSESLMNLDACVSMNWSELAKAGALHTRESLSERTGLQPYDLWKEIHLASADEGELPRLMTKVE